MAESITFFSESKEFEPIGENTVVDAHFEAIYLTSSVNNNSSLRAVVYRGTFRAGSWSRGGEYSFFQWNTDINTNDMMDICA